ncbi:MAG TPA: hypothetical protein VF039_14370 [Longimicrobiales bacterium]
MRLERGRVGPILARWTTELLVVFIGVYGAFVVAEWDEKRERSERVAQINGALVEEIRDIQGNTHRVALWAPSYLAGLDSALARGVPVAPQPWLEPVSIQPHVWNATLTSGALDLLSVETFLEVSEFYNLLTLGFEQIAQLRSLSETQLLPRLGDPASTFYTASGGGPALRFRPEYEWYPGTMERLGTLARCITMKGDSALAALGAAPDPAYGGLDAEGC